MHGSSYSMSRLTGYQDELMSIYLLHMHVKACSNDILSRSPENTHEMQHKQITLVIFITILGLK